MFAAAAAGEAPKCKLLRIEDWAVRPDHYRPVVDGAVNGQKVGVLLDTGASHSLILRAATGRLGLTRQPAHGYRTFGIGGETQAEAVDINEFRIGKAVRKNWRVMVIGEHDFGDDVVVMLGEDFFHQVEIEFDLHSNAVRIFQAKDCQSAPLAYWSRQALDVPLHGSEKILLTVAINGKPLRAMLDSGASYSLLAKVDAEERGLKPGSPGVEPAGCVGGFGAKSVDSWTGQFDTFAIGDELIRNPRIRFAELWAHTTVTETGSRVPNRLAGLPPMLLGADFLRSHRVLIARSQRKMYFTYEGGTVFPPVTGRGCNARSQ